MTKTMADVVKSGALVVTSALNSFVGGGGKKEEEDSIPEEVEDERNADFIFESLLSSRQPDEITVR